MTDINSRLIRFNGEIGPQYLDTEDKTDGLDGTMKAVEGKDGNLYVHDRDVKAELELIKQQQQQILERLDNGVDTRLIGSNVGYSNETKPIGKKGETFLELDTLDVYIHDGSGWVKI